MSPQMPKRIIVFANGMMALIKWLNGPDRWPLFARVVVPSIVLLFSISGGDIFSGRSRIGETISAVKMQSATDSKGNTVANEATLLIVESDKKLYTVILSGGTKRIWASLSVHERLVHHQGLIIDTDQGEMTNLSIKMPLPGKPLPLVILIEGDSVPNIWIDGNQKPIFPDYRLRSKRSESIVMWCFIASVFSLGVTAAGSHLRVSQPNH